MSVEGSLSIDSKNLYETTISRNNELFWTEKFIVLAGAHFYASVAGSCPLYPPEADNSETPRYVRFVPQSRPNAPQYTLSACASSVDGTSRPTAFTVSKLPMRSNSQTRPRVSPSGACRSPRVPSL